MGIRAVVLHHLHEGLDDDVVELRRRIQAEEPGDAGMWYRLGTLYDRGGNTDDADVAMAYAYVADTREDYHFRWPIAQRFADYPVEDVYALLRGTYDDLVEQGWKNPLAPPKVTAHIQDEMATLYSLTNVGPKWPEILEYEPPKEHYMPNSVLAYFSEMYGDGMSDAIASPEGGGDGAALFRMYDEDRPLVIDWGNTVEHARAAILFWDSAGGEDVQTFSDQSEAEHRWEDIEAEYYQPEEEEDDPHREEAEYMVYGGEDPIE